MRLIEIVLMIFLIPVFAGIFEFSGRNFRQLEIRRRELTDITECLAFMDGSFSGYAANSREEFDAFYELCNELWKLESFFIKEIGFKDNQVLIEVSWKIHGTELKKYLVIKT